VDEFIVDTGERGVDGVHQVKVEVQKVFHFAAYLGADKIEQILPVAVELLFSLLVVLLGQSLEGPQVRFSVELDLVAFVAFAQVDAQVRQRQDAAVDVDQFGFDLLVFLLLHPPGNSQVAVQPCVPEASSLGGDRQLVHIEVGAYFRIGTQFQNG